MFEDVYCSTISTSLVPVPLNGFRGSLITFSVLDYDPNPLDFLWDRLYTDLRPHSSPDLGPPKQ